MDKVIEQVKNIGALVLDVLGIVPLCFYRCYKNKQVIRVVNYHRTPAEELENFEKHLQWYQKEFQNINKISFEQFMNGSLKLKTIWIYRLVFCFFRAGWKRKLYVIFRHERFILPRTCDRLSYILPSPHE